MSQQRDIISRSSFVAFAASFTKLQIAHLKNRETGDRFTCLAFTKANAKVNPKTGNPEHTFVSFSTKLGELSPQELVSKKDKLLVVELAGDVDEETGEIKSSYVLCNKGEDTWEEVDLGLL